MNKILKKLTKRNIVGNFKQFLSVIFIVLLSTMLLSGFITSSFTLKSAINRYFENTNLADIWITTDKVTEEDEKFFQDNNIEYNKRLYFESVAEIKTLQLENSVRVYVYKSKIEEPYSRICEPYIESGKVYQDSGCLIDKNVAKDHHINAGFDNITFSYTANIGGEDIVLNFDEQLTGTMSLDECADSYSSWAIVVEEEMFFRKLKEKLQEKFGSEYSDDMLPELPYNQILIKTETIEQTTSLIKNHYAREGATSSLLYLFGRESIESVQLLSDEVKQSVKMIYVFPIMFLIVAILVILSTIDQLIIQERKRIGILKCCGVPNKKILRHYSRYGSILCLIGALAGIVLGVIIIPEVMFSKYGMIYSIPKDYIKIEIPFEILFSMFISIVVLGYVVSVISCYKILNKNPIDCLRFDSPMFTAKFKKRKKQYKKVPIAVRVAVRNIKMKPLRTVMATIGISGCIALLLAGFGIGDTLSKSLNNDFGKQFCYDVSTTYKNDEFIEKLNQNSNIEYFEKTSRAYVEVSANERNKDVYVYQLAENSKLSNIKLSAGEVKISSKIADDLSVSKGDKIVVKSYGLEKELVVSGIVETSILNGIYVAEDLGFAEGFVTKMVWAKCDNDAAVVEFMNDFNDTNTAQTIESQKSAVKNRIMSTATMTNTIKVFAVLLAIIVLLNLIFLILKERSIQIATMKVLGQNSLQISISVFLEVMFMAAIGMVCGMLLGYPLLLLILSINKVEMINYIFSLKFVSFLLSAVIVILTILVVLLVCYLKIRKVDMAEALKRVD